MIWVADIIYILMGITSTGRILLREGQSLHAELSRALSECRRSHEDNDAGGSPTSRRRRVPTGEAGRAGADTLGQILGWNPSSGTGGAIGGS